MSFPKIVYNAGAGNVTLQFQQPPRNVPAYQYGAVRHDNLASSGVRESILERIDTFLELEMEWAAIGADISAWNNFMLWALTGGSFTYYADSSQTVSTLYWLEDTDWNAACKVPGRYTFKLKFRQVVT